MEHNTTHEECCYKSVFGGNVKRVGRCNYRCDYCARDVSLLWAFYQMSKEDYVKNDGKPMMMAYALADDKPTKKKKK